MRRIIQIFLCGALIMPFLVQAQLATLRSQDSVRVLGGRVRVPAVLADDGGKVFIEVPDGMIAKIKGQPHFNFDGYLLAPDIVALPEKLPFARSREYVTFSFQADNGDPLSFSDRFFKIPYKRRLFIENEKTKTIRAYIPVSVDDEVKRPELWFYDEKFNSDPFDDEWRHIGGVYEGSTDPNVNLFSAALTRTGVYSLVDRQPQPVIKEVAVDPSQVQTVPQSPYPSVDLPPANSDPQAPVENNTSVANVDDGVPVIDPQNQEVSEFEVPAVAPLPESSLPKTSTQGSVGATSEDDLSTESKTVSPQESSSKTNESFEGLKPMTAQELEQKQQEKATSELSLMADSFNKDGMALPKTGGNRTSTFFIWLTVMIFIAGGYLYFREQKAINEDN